MAQRVFWAAKTLTQMSAEEFEAVCDGCGKCCLHKLEDEDTDEVYYTKVACRLLDAETCRCTSYEHRQQEVEGCLVLTPNNVKDMWWLPETCAYRLLDAGLPLFDWHPLVSGDPDSVHKANMSVAGKVVPETSVAEEDFEDYIVRWV
ncbi:MAG: YcgN family cysteine cluster protein [Cellvibrio sp.]